MEKEDKKNGKKKQELIIMQMILVKRMRRERIEIPKKNEEKNKKAPETKRRIKRYKIHFTSDIAFGLSL